MWLLLFHHDCEGKVFFSNANEVTNSNTENKYSILYTLSDNLKTLKNGLLKFEFIIEWPDSLKGYYQWRQSMNPLNEKEGSAFSASGFEPIVNQSDYGIWGGLVRGSESCTLLNGTPGYNNNWCISKLFSICQEHFSEQLKRMPIISTIIPIIC